MNAIVTAAVVNSVPLTLAAVLSYRAAVNTKHSKAAIQRVDDKANANNTVLHRIEKATNGELERKIRTAVRDELITHSENTTEMRDLLDAILRGVQGEDTQ